MGHDTIAYTWNYLHDPTFALMHHIFVSRVLSYFLLSRLPVCFHLFAFKYITIAVDSSLDFVAAMKALSSNLSDKEETMDGRICLATGLTH